MSSISADFLYLKEIRGQKMRRIPSVDAITGIRQFPIKNCSKNYHFVRQRTNNAELVQAS
jgi:hypothetical protein